MISGRAPEFDLPALAGGRKSLKDLISAAPVLLVFYKVSCPTCQLTLPFIERLGKAGKVDGPQVVAISQDDAQATATFNLRFGISLPTLLDPPRTPGIQPYPASNAYRITNVPSLFLVESDGQISRSVDGFDKAEMMALGEIFGVDVFTPSDRVPVFRPG